MKPVTSLLAERYFNFNHIPQSFIAQDRLKEDEVLTANLTPAQTLARTRLAYTRRQFSLIELEEDWFSISARIMILRDNVGWERACLLIGLLLSRRALLKHIATRTLLDLSKFAAREQIAAILSLDPEIDARLPRCKTIPETFAFSAAMLGSLGFCAFASAQWPAPVSQRLHWRAKREWLSFPPIPLPMTSEKLSLLVDAVEMLEQVTAETNANITSKQENASH
jgi:hypothetical protein